jgi:aromatic ring hydroxylase
MRTNKEMKTTETDENERSEKFFLFHQTSEKLSDLTKRFCVLNNQSNFEKVSLELR